MNVKAGNFRTLLAAGILLIALCVAPAGPVNGQGPGLAQTFDDPTLPGWEHTPDVAVANGVLRVPAPGFASYDGAWGDVALTLWARRYGEGALVLTYRAGEDGYYAVRLGADAVALQRVAGSDVIELGTTSAAVPSGGWFQIGVIVAGGEHVVLLDHAPVLFATDPDPLPPGGLGFRVEGAAVGEFDDLLVTAGGEAPPVVQALPVEGQPAAVPTAQASPAPVSPPQVAPPGECTQSVAPGGLQNAAQTAQPGDVVCVTAGDYSGEGEIRFAVSGTAERPITFAADGAVTVHALTLEQGASYLRLQGFTVTGFDVWGVTLLGSNEDVLLSGLVVIGGESGVHLTYGESGGAPRGGPVNNITLADSVVRDPLYTAIDCTPGPCNNIRFQRLEVSGAGHGEASYGSDALAVEMGAYILVEDCYLHDNSGDGIDLNSRNTGPAPGIVVRRNRVFNAALNGIKLWNGGEASNNVVWHSGDTMLVLEPGDYTIANNTFASVNGYTYLAVLGGYETAGPSTIRLYNNIFYNDNPAMGGTLLYFAAGVQLESDHNFYYNPYREEDVIVLFVAGAETGFNRDQINDGTLFAQTGHDEHSLYADPLFADAANGDFHLTVGSPAVDAGVTNEWVPADDLEANPRPAGRAPDLGAYESN